MSKQQEKKNLMSLEKEVSKDGEFKRTPSQLTDLISPEHPVFKPERGRYHLFLSHACPWCHAVEMVMRVLGIWDSNVIEVSFVDAEFQPIGEGRSGWHFSEKFPNRLNDKKTMWDVYVDMLPEYTGKATVPLLVDKKTNRLVCNESTILIESFTSYWTEFKTKDCPDLTPDHLRGDIEKWNEKTYNSLKNGVYRAGFAQKQEAYEVAVNGVFDTLDMLETHLDKNLYICGDTFTTIDILVFATLIRFDSVYRTHFKCTKKMIAEFENLSNYTRHIYQMEKIKPSVEFDHIRQHYYLSHTSINPFKIVPPAPRYNWNAPHDRLSKFQRNYSTTTAASATKRLAPVNAGGASRFLFGLGIGAAVGATVAIAVANKK